MFSLRVPGFNAQEGFPIRTSPDQRLLATSRSLSQLATSFIAILHQGIHRMPLVAWYFFLTMPSAHVLNCQRAVPFRATFRDVMVENTGFEPVTSALQGRRSPY